MKKHHYFGSSITYTMRQTEEHNYVIHTYTRYRMPRTSFYIKNDYQTMSVLPEYGYEAFEININGFQCERLLDLITFMVAMKLNTEELLNNYICI